jgi:hypothetical protein
LSLAIEAARQLLATARSGDSFSIVLAGYPARVLTPTTTELSSLDDILESIPETDRRTDIEAALDLARGLQADLPQKDRPIVLLSDLSSPDTLNLSDVLVPDAGLRSPLSNCALVNAIRSERAVQMEISCTGTEAVSERTVDVIDANGRPLGPPVKARDGAVRFELAEKAKAPSDMLLTARLSPPKDPQNDQISADDTCVVLSGAATLTVALRADQSRAGVKTGANTVVQTAIEALDAGVRVQTLTLLPDRSTDLDSYGALLIDDPSGFTPEVGEAISGWVERGGVAVTFLGPGILSMPLGSSFAPFLDAPPRWEASPSLGADPETPGSLGPLTTTWENIGARKRATVSPDERAEIKARFSDGAPLVLEKPEGRGLLLTVTLPSSVDLSDLALRPAFLELIDYAVTQSAIRRGAQATVVGERWNVAHDAIVRDPSGSIVEKKSRLLSDSEEADAQDNNRKYVEPDLAGRYTLTQPTSRGENLPSFRYAVRDLTEHVAQPNEQITSGSSTGQQATLTQVGISREIALLALLLSALELAYRALRRARQTPPLPSAVS